MNDLPEITYHSRIGRSSPVGAWGALPGVNWANISGIDAGIARIAAEGRFDPVVDFGSTALLPQQTTAQIMSNIQQRRIVQVFIADPSDNVPLDHAIIHRTEEKLTDLTDAELFFECPIAEKLAEHNKKRVTWLDKEASKRSGKDVMLDPIKIRDLRMVVVSLAVF